MPFRRPGLSASPPHRANGPTWLGFQQQSARDKSTCLPRAHLIVSGPACGPPSCPPPRMHASQLAKNGVASKAAHLSVLFASYGHTHSTAPEGGDEALGQHAYLCCSAAPCSTTPQLASLTVPPTHTSSRDGGQATTSVTCSVGCVLPLACLAAMFTLPKNHFKASHTLLLQEPMQSAAGGRLGPLRCAARRVGPGGQPTHHRQLEKPACTAKKRICALPKGASTQPALYLYCPCTSSSLCAQDEGSAAAGSCGEQATPLPEGLNTRLPLAAAEGRSSARTRMHGIVSSNLRNFSCCGGLRSDDEQGMHSTSAPYDADGDHSDTSSDAAARASGLGLPQHSPVTYLAPPAAGSGAQSSLEVGREWTAGGDSGPLLPTMTNLHSSCREPASTNYVPGVAGACVPRSLASPPGRVGGSKRRRSNTAPDHQSQAKAPRALRLHMTSLHGNNPSTPNQIAIECNLNPVAWLPFCGDSHGLVKQRVAAAPA